MSDALTRLPKGFAENYVRQIYGVSSLEGYGVQFGGTNVEDKIYLLYREDSSCAGTTRRLYAELSSLVLRANPGILDVAQWESVNPDGFSYGSSGVDAIREGNASTELDPREFSSGFLSQYARSTLENDFNAISAGLFMGIKQMWQAAQDYPRLAAKLNITIKFYETVDPRLTRSYFVALRQ